MTVSLLPGPPPPQLGGLTLVALGVWVSVDGASFLQLLGPFSQQGLQFVNVGFFCAAIGAVLLLLGLLGCCSAHKESRCLLLTVGFYQIGVILWPTGQIWPHSVIKFGPQSITKFTTRAGPP